MKMAIFALPYIMSIMVTNIYTYKTNIVSVLIIITDVTLRDGPDILIVHVHDSNSCFVL